jgi:predicted amidohydrolase YtcJ
MLWTIPRCYDSHTHLLATGILQSGLRLFDLTSAEDVKNLKIEPHHFRGSWLVGFGWDQSKWPGGKFPTKEILDSIFPDFPVAFSRADGHATWLNSKALEAVGYLNTTELQKPTPVGGVITRDWQGWPTGIFFESAKVEVDLAIPDHSPKQQKDFLKAAIRYFNQRGFSHLRDMSGFIGQWELLRELDLTSELTLYVEENFTCENLKDFERALLEAKQARQSETKHLKARGIKFYFDGSLGSQGAFLSQFYPGTDNKGLTLWPLPEVAEVIERTWQAGFEVCVHTIGDQAAHLVLQTAAQVTREKSVTGVLNLEHSEVVRNESLELMKSLSVVCHIQPCHWLTDRRWLKEKLGALYGYAFPWKALYDHQIVMQWGSDSPIEEASVWNNWKALQESSKEGIAAYPGNWLSPHSHRESDWGSDCQSIFENGKLTEFVFDGKKISIQEITES